MYIETENHNARASAAIGDMIEAALRVCRHMLRDERSGGRFAVIDCVTDAVFCYFSEIVDGGFPHGVILCDEYSEPANPHCEELDDELALAIERLYMAYRDAYKDVDEGQVRAILNAVADSTSRMLAQTLALLLSEEQGRVVTELHSSQT